MSLRYLHIRECDEDGEMLQTGGATLVYSVSPETEAIYINMARCSGNDQFCRATGREVARKRLYDDGPYDIITLKHPIVDTIIWWFIERFGYMVIKTRNGHWMSTFSEVDPEDLGLIRYEPMPDRFSTEFTLE